MIKGETALTVPRLLSALVLLAGVSFGFFGWDFERAIGRLDAIDQTQGQMQITQATTTARVDGLSVRVDGLASTSTDHEKRLAFVEANKADKK